MRREPQGSSPFLTSISVSVEFEQGRQASSCVEAWSSTSLLSCEWGVRPLAELHLEPVAFSEDVTGVSVPLGVATQYSVFHSNQALSRVDGEISVFGIVA